MVNTQELLDKEEKEAMEAYQNHLKGLDAEPVQEEVKPVEEAKPEVQPPVEQPQPSVERPAEPVKVEEKPKEEVKIDYDKYESEFNALGVRLEPEKANDPKYLKARFLSTAGIAKKQANELKALKEEAERVRRENEQLKFKAVSEVPVTKKAVEEVDEDIGKIKQDLLSDFEGNEKVIEKLDAYFSAKTKHAERELKNKLSEIEKRQQEAESSRVYNEFWRNVFDNAPEAKEVLDKENYAFKAFLEQPQSHFKGMLNRNLYEDACNRGDAQTIAQLFRDYVNETRSEVVNKNEVKVENKNINTIPEVIKNQVSPNSMPASSVQSQNVAKVWTVNEINNVYDKATEGRISTEDATRLMREIDLAIMEGRVK